MEPTVPDAKPLILCVDDEAIPLLLRKSVLQKAGYQVIAASSGKEALEILAIQPVDLVLTDLLMPGLSGTDLAREIRKRTLRIPVVLFSGVNEIPGDAVCADLFISKVEGPEIMCEKVAEMLRTARAAHS
jgi:CheY-like chemotaxis protein